MERSAFHKNGQMFNIFVDNSALDYSSKEVQLQLISMNDAIRECTDCSEPWTVEDSLISWYDLFRLFVFDHSIEDFDFQDYTVNSINFYSHFEEFL